MPFQLQLTYLLLAAVRGTRVVPGEPQSREEQDSFRTQMHQMADLLGMSERQIREAIDAEGVVFPVQWITGEVVRRFWPASPARTCVKPVIL